MQLSACRTEFSTRVSHADPLKKTPHVAGSKLASQQMKDEDMIRELNSFSAVMTQSGKHGIALLIVIFHNIAVWAHEALVSS